MENLLAFDAEPLASVWTRVPLQSAATIAALVGVRDIARQLPRPGPAWIGTTAALLLVAFVVTHIIAPAALRAPMRSPVILTSVTLRFGLILLVAAIGLRLGLAAAPEPEDRAWAGVAIAFGLWACANLAALLNYGSMFLAGMPERGAIFAAVPILALVAFLPGAGSGHRERRRRVYLALLAATLVGAAHAAVSTRGDTPLFGIARSIGAFFLIRAVIKHDLLGVPLPRLAKDRGVLAAGALAALFIVAELAQQFLATKYGILMGGIVAGSLLFAASPIQRALERRQEPPAPPRSPREAAIHEEVYKAAVRLALRGGIDPREEIELMRIADAHGITHLQAAALRREVEAERADQAA